MSGGAGAGANGLTRARGAARMPGVNWLRRIIALVLLALWLPATSHCALETVLGVVNDHCESSCSHDFAGGDADAAAHLAADSCDVVESGAFKPVLESLAAPAPSLWVLVCLSCVHAVVLAEARPLAPPAWSADNPDSWVPARHLARRAIAPARAPGLS